MGRDEDFGGILTTADVLLFTANHASNLLALAPANGKVLWHVNAGGRVVMSPTTYELHGQQYVLLAANDVVDAGSLQDFMTKK